MSTRKTLEFTCDICAARSGEVSCLPKGWAKIIVENKYVDRDFHDKHVCDGCARKIARQTAP
jgi:hypothetical protein